MKTVFLDAEGLLDCDLTLLRQKCSSLVVHEGTSQELLAARTAGAEVLLVNKVKIGRELLRSSPDLKLICVVATGIDVIDLDAAEEFGVTVCNCQAYGTASVVQHVFSAILALQTNIFKYHQAVREGRWQSSTQFCFLDYPIVELAGKTLGIVGYGTLGKAVAKVAECFGMRVMVSARPGSVSESRPPLEQLLAEVDVLTLHCPLTDQTRGLIGKEQLAMMKPGALLINAARGGVVDEAALAGALCHGQLAGAAVDVLSVEPPRDGNVLLDPEIPNLIITPHIAWASNEARQKIIDQTVENIIGFQTGKPVRVVSGC